LVSTEEHAVFEEAQLYSPVTTGAGGEVTVHLHDGHPGADDPEYRRRRNEIAAAALRWRPGTPAPRIDYSAAEQGVWRTVCRELAPLHEQLAVGEYRDALARLDLPADHIPSLDEVSARLQALSGWSYVPAAGLVDLRTFYAALGDRVFHSTQYVRHAAMPLYTPEPDIVHEVLGHGHLLATPTFGELHRRAGAASVRLREEESLRFLSRVFWFTVEFGVVVEDGELRAYGAGILSSSGEIAQFRAMQLRPLDLREMGTADYDITHYQPVLYRADSVAEIEAVVGGFFDTCTDESIEELRREHAVA
jgi:phenylalanine-4-hydroxylase